eukprot:31461-Pelagococcus_subviridis.AAC.1
MTDVEYRAARRATRRPRETKRKKRGKRSRGLLTARVSRPRQRVLQRHRLIVVPVHDVRVDVRKKRIRRMRFQIRLKRVRERDAGLLRVVPYERTSGWS